MGWLSRIGGSLRRLRLSWLAGYSSNVASLGENNRTNRPSRRQDAADRNVGKDEVRYSRSFSARGILHRHSLLFRGAPFRQRAGRCPAPDARGSTAGTFQQ